MKSSEKKIFSCILVIAILLVGVALLPVYLNQRPRKVATPEPKLSRELLVPPDSPIRGNKDAKTTIVVFSDFQCSSCAGGVPIVENILKEKKGEVNLVFHHFQVRPDHIYAPTLSRAAECARKQNKFWEMHDRLFLNQKDLTASGSEEQLLSQIRHHANQIGLDMMKFDLDMKNKVGEDRFNADNKLAVRVNIPSTPTYFVIDPAGEVKRYEGNPALQGWAKGTK